MRDSFVTPDFVLDLRRMKISYTEQSPRFKDTFFTKYSFPFQFEMDRDLRITMGNYTKIGASGLKGSHEGFHIFEGKAYRGILEITEVTGNTVSAQIDSGFEELPNFGKKLKELPFPKNRVADIYAHANDICQKKYPETDYNFPRVIYDKHDEKEKGWEAFNQYINDRDATAFRSNGENGTHVNRNIIHPMPYLLYVLKLGFSDAGYELAGDILTDTDFRQRLIFSFKENFVTSETEHTEITILSDEYNTITSSGVASYRKEIKLNTVTRYLLRLDVNLISQGQPSRVTASVNGNEVFRDFTFQTRKSALNFTFDNSDESGTLVIEIQTVPGNVIAEGIAEKIITKERSGQNITDTFRIYNLNEINLRNSVPDITFGELVTTIKNWKNYDLEIQGSQAVMNRLNSTGFSQMKDFSQYGILHPTRTFLHKRSFHLSLADLDDDNTANGVLIDQNGNKIGGEPGNDTTQLKINAYCMPLEKFRGRPNAAIKKDDHTTLALIYYDGLHQGQNFAQNPPGLMLPEILGVWSPWYAMRIHSSELKWTFAANRNRFRNFSIRDTLYCYGMKLWIKEITKNIVSKEMYEVEITAEEVR
ncbi:MAG: hypothetical protein Q4G08_05975 [Capnocytophaga sp.]|nr:hypothetical protein [Capnocytophaga sp.]